MDKIKLRITVVATLAVFLLKGTDTFAQQTDPTLTGAVFAQTSTLKNIYDKRQKAHEKIIAAVEQWSKEHPHKTRQSVFLEQYPEARIGDDGVLQILPCSISASHRNARGNCVNMRRDCYDCRREFWMQEVE